MSIVKKTFKVGEKSFDMEMKEDGTVIETPGFQAELDTITAKSLRVDALEKEVTALKTPIVNGIILLQKSLEMTEEKAEILQAQPMEALQKSLESLQKLDLKLNPKSQVAENGGKAEETLETPSF